MMKLLVTYVESWTRREITSLSSVTIATCVSISSAMELIQYQKDHGYVLLVSKQHSTVVSHLPNNYLNYGLLICREDFSDSKLFKHQR